MFHVIVRATSVVIKPGKEAMSVLTPLINLHTYEDEFQDVTRVLGFIYDEQHDVLYFHRGIDIQYLRKLLVSCDIVSEPFDPYVEMKYNFEEVIPPRDDDQQDCIDFIAGENAHASNINDSQIFLVKKTGFGKTFCTGYAIGLYTAKALIVTHRDNLRDQSLDSLINMNGYPECSMHEITTTAEFEQIATGRFDRNAYRDIDIFLITHATFRAGLKRVGDIEIAQNFGRNLGIGLKVIDEAHLEFRDTILLDIVFNVRRNLYITATDGRSSKDENSIFRHVFSNTTFYQKKVLDPKIPKHPDKWVEYITVDVNTHVKPNVYRFRVAGGKGMSAVSYGKWVIAHDPKQTHFKACVDIVKQIYKEEPTAKILLFMPLIELCTECAYFLIQHLNYDESFDYDLNIKTVNSHNSKSENEINKRADIIVTTIQSLGTGSDIKGVTDIINCSPIVSKIVVQQVLGRIRYIPKKCHYYDIVDQSVPADRFWWKSRSKTLKRLCTNSQHISWVEEEPV
jgi:hypothetical protein